MTDMIERVARALCKADGKNPDALHSFGTCDGAAHMPNWQFHYSFAAVRAIEAMREPTADMLEAIYESESYYIGSRTWAKAIDAALRN